MNQFRNPAAQAAAGGRPVIDAPGVSAVQWCDQNGANIPEPAANTLVFLPIYVKESSPSGTMVYTDVWNANKGPWHPPPSLTFRGGGANWKVTADKAYNTEPMSNFNKRVHNYHIHPWSCWMSANRPSLRVEGMHHEKSYYVVWMEWVHKPSGGGPTPGPLVAQFLTTPDRGTAPVDLVLTDKSTGPVAKWDWKVTLESDPSKVVTSNVQHPTLRLSTPGTYTVRLVVSSAAGQASAPAEKRGAVTVLAAQQPGPARVVGHAEVQQDVIGRTKFNGGQVLSVKPTGQGVAGRIIVHIEKSQLAALRAQYPNSSVISVQIATYSVDSVEARILDDTPHFD